MGRAPDTSIIASGTAVLDGLGWGKQAREASIMSISRGWSAPPELGQAPEASIMSIRRDCYGPLRMGQAPETSIMSISGGSFGLQGWDCDRSELFWLARAGVTSTRSEHHKHHPQLRWPACAGPVSWASKHHEPHVRLLFDLLRHEHQKGLFWAAHLKRAV